MRKSDTEFVTPPTRLQREFFIRDVLDIAPMIPGKFLVVNFAGRPLNRLMITEAEAYRGTEDLACHASKGRTTRTEIMFHEGGSLYMFLIYGMYWMLNIVTGPVDEPQAILIRGAGDFDGPGKLTRALGIDRSFYGEDLVTSKRIWLEDSDTKQIVKISPRIGIDYAGDFWKSRPWRFFI
jgi:DNA-3-methyladenine glycosylase